jgi:hypothetical protein
MDREVLRALVVSPALECILEDRDARLGNKRGGRRGKTALAQNGGDRCGEPPR